MRRVPTPSGDDGSMRRAARVIGLTPSAISEQIRQLEKETGVTLLRRTTRKLALTNAGRAFHEGCVAMLEAATYEATPDGPRVCRLAVSDYAASPSGRRPTGPRRAQEAHV